MTVDDKALAAALDAVVIMRNGVDRLMQGLADIEAAIASHEVRIAALEAAAGHSRPIIINGLS